MELGFDIEMSRHERFDFKFLVWTWGYPNRSRPRVLALLESYRDSRRMVHLTGAREVDRFVAEQSVPAAVS